MRSSALVRKLETFADLTGDEQARLIAICQDTGIVPAKRDIVSEGAQPDRLHIVLEGWAARYKVLPDGSRQITAFLIPGDICDLHVNILGRIDHGIVALTQCRIAYVESGEMDRLAAENSKLARALWWSTLVDEAVLRTWVVNNGRRSAYQRIAHLFCEIHLRMKSVGLAHDSIFDLPLTQEDIADATGLTAVHTNRTLQRLRTEGLIELRGRVLHVKDLAGLREAAGFDPAYLHIERRLH